MSTFRVRLSQGSGYTGGGRLDRISQLTGTISDATNASPIVVTSSSHGLTSGTKLTVSGIVGTTSANSDWIITVLTADTFSLNGSSGNGGYSSGGVWRVDSNQRTMYAMGPNKINRKLKDGDSFTDCNYWKRFAYPQVPYNEAFIEVVSDDGAPYVDGVASNFVVNYTASVAALSSMGDNDQVDIIGDYGSYASWAIISPDATVTCRINESSASDFSITGSTSHTFNSGDVLIGTLDFAKATSGSASVDIQVGILSNCNS